MVINFNKYVCMYVKAKHRKAHEKLILPLIPLSAGFYSQ